MCAHDSPQPLEAFECAMNSVWQYARDQTRSGGSGIYSQDCKRLRALQPRCSR